MSDTVIASIQPTIIRRAMAVGLLLTLGGLLIYLAVFVPPELGWQVFLLALGVGTLALGDKVRRDTALSLELTETELRDSAGRVLCRIEDVLSVDRGALAFKPSNGFLLRLRAGTSPGAAWAPGLWWRVGRRIGVGGVIQSGQGKMIAELIAVRVAQRDARAAGATD